MAGATNGFLGLEVPRLCVFMKISLLIRSRPCRFFSFKSELPHHTHHASGWRVNCITGRMHTQEIRP